jgi:ABC-type antimicrobial peptide transport system permease subunit
MNSCSHDFPKTNGFQFVTGRDFSRAFSTDSSAVIVNEMAASLFGHESVLGKKIKFGHGKEREIIGVIKDQVRWGPFAKQSPHLYYINYHGMGYLTIRLSPGVGMHDALAKVESIIAKYDDEAPFDYKFQDDDYARQFSSEEHIAKLAAVFAVLAIFISCIGILGLAAFAASRRSREIGIRKVLGASVFNLWRMLSNDFMQLVLISILVASPVAYFFADRWLQQYEYRVSIPWLVFAATGVAALVITLAVVSYQTVKAALANPVKSLRSE